MVTLLRRLGPARTPSEAGAELGPNLRHMRQEKNLTLDELAIRSGVSRAMISKIERGKSAPTATVLGKLAKGLNAGLSQLIGGYRQREPMLLSPFEQPVFRDPQSGLERRSLSPLFPDRRVDFVVNTLPVQGSVAFPPHHQGVEEYLYVNRGTLLWSSAKSALKCPPAPRFITTAIFSTNSTMLEMRWRSFSSSSTAMARTEALCSENNPICINSHP